MRNLSGFSLVVATLLGSTSTAALAQDAQTTDAPAQEKSTGLDDIVVTAQRRAERLQDVPIAVSAFAAESLKAQRIGTTEDLKFSVPSLNYSAQAGFAVPFLRGIGSDITQPNSDPGVATYVDGVFMANVSGTITSLLGVERVEVLLGPQGTLFGKNAVGGAISITTRTPKEELEGEITAGFGNHQRFEASGYVSGGIANGLYAGIYATGIRRDSFYRHLVPINQRMIDGTPGHEYNWGIRGKIVFESGALRMVASIEQAEGSSADAGILQNIQPTGLGVVAFGAPFVGDRHVDSNDGGTLFATKSTLAILRTEVDLDWSQFVSISGYRKLRARTLSDFDGTSAPLVNLLALPNASDDYSQEIQLQSAPGSNITWIVGAYGFYENGGFLPTGVATSVLFAPVLGPGTFANISYGRVKTKSLAGFSQVTVPFGERLRLTLGARYSHDWKTLDSSNGFTTIENGQVIREPFANTVFPRVKGNWGAFTPKVTIDYKADGAMYYATFSKGYRPGTFNVSSPATPGPVNPEKLTSYEVGVKSDLFDGNVRFNASAYYYKFNDIQVQVNAQDQGSLAILQNGAKATAWGVEASLMVKVTPELTFETGASAEDTKYNKFEDFAGYTIGQAGNTPTTLDVSGNDLVRAPKFVLNTTLRYDKELPSGDRVGLNVNWYHNDGFYWEASNQLRQPAYDLFNASASYTIGDKDWIISGWIKNISNKRYFNTQLLSDFGVVANDADPRTFGMTVTKTF